MHANIVRRNGYLGLEMDGKVYSPVALRSFRPDGRILRDFARNDFELFNVFPSGMMTGLANRTIPYSQFGEVWSGENTYCWDHLRQQVDLFVENTPNGMISLAIQLDPPEWYRKAHPEYADSWQELIQVAGDPKWRKDAAAYLRATMDKLDEWLPGRVYGVFLMAGGTTEWYTRDLKSAVVPRPMQTAAFRAWARDPEAVIPPPDALFHTSDGVLLDPARDAEAIRYWHFVNEIVTDTIAYFARVTKAHCGGTKLVGAFTGYLHGMSLDRAVTSSYNEIARLLDNPDLDVIFCPASYCHRKLWDTSAFRVPVDSFSRKGKLYFHELDSTTHLTHDDPIAKLHSRHDGPFETLTQTAAYSRREVGMVLAKGQGYWWFDMFGGWYDDPALMAELQNLRKLTDIARTRGMRPVAEVALCLDLPSNYLLGADVGYPLPQALAPCLNRMGLPWDSLLTGDLLDPDFDADRYKLFLFPNLFQPEEAVVQRIGSLRMAGKSLLFFHAPGYADASGHSLARMAEVTGMRLSRARAQAAQVRLNAFPDAPVEMRAEKPGNPWIHPLFTADGSIEALGTFEETGETAVAVRTRGASFDAFSAVGPLPSVFLRGLAMRAGAFAYLNSEDPVYANDHLCTVFCHEPGPRVLCWPHPATLREFFTGELYATGPAGCVIPFAADQTKIFLVD